MNRVPAKKHLGQNFLIDPSIVKRIISHCDIKPNETILEIGPGTGALTDSLGSLGNQVIAIEKDPRLMTLLKEKFQEKKNIEIIHKDFLKFDLATLPPKTKIIGNIPYNISSPILEKFLTEPHSCRDIFFTVQWEFGQRLAAQPGNKDYGALTCFAQFFADVKILFPIPASVFRPAPKVRSCFLKITFLGPKDNTVNPDRLFALIRTSFQQRRKKIRNALAPILKERLAEILKTVNLNENLRPENLSLGDYISIVKQIN